MFAMTWISTASRFVMDGRILRREISDMYDSKTYGAFNEMTTRHTDFTASNATRYRAIKEHLLSELNEEAVILSLKNGKYYGLNSVGFTIWTNIQEAATLSEIETAVMNEYDVDEETCRRAVSLFLEQMAGEQLVEIVDDPSF